MLFRSTQLTSPAVVNALGNLGTPPLSAVPPGLGTNFQEIPTGFGSYLQGIIPSDVAVACGAFSVAVRQVKNVESIPIEKFAQVVANVETTKNLPLSAGTSVPSNVGLTNGGLTQTALGSGPNGSWVMSDFLGCMSGLPYAWGDIQSSILALQTIKLTNIYQELYLATSWNGATLTVTYTTNPDTTLHITGVTIDNAGGGYGRGGAPAPTITIA